MRRLVGFLASLSLTGCMASRYLPQAAAGQLDLMTSGRCIERVVADPTTPPETARLLAEVAPVRDFARAHGLRVDRNYRRYVELDRDAVVWFVTGSRPLAFEPRVYWFPIAGSFAGVGWFHERAAERHARRLERRGWDADWREAMAYSTGGWFRDPIVSSMFGVEELALGDLVNTVLHESVHATVLVHHQTYFNESLASFVADTMTPEYLASRRGSDAPETVAYTAAQTWRRAQESRVLAAYAELERLYASPLSEAEKRARKYDILIALREELRLARTPNNASLLGAKLYGAGFAELGTLLTTCAHDWRRFLGVVGALRPSDFPRRQAEDFPVVVARLAAAGCPSRDAH